MFHKKNLFITWKREKKVERLPQGCNIFCFPDTIKLFEFNNENFSPRTHRHLFQFEQNLLLI